MQCGVFVFGGVINTQCHPIPATSSRLWSLELPDKRSVKIFSNSMLFSASGTTDNPCEIKDNPAPSEAEIQFILNEVKNYLNPDVNGKRSQIFEPHWIGHTVYFPLQYWFNTPGSYSNDTVKVDRLKLVMVIYCSSLEPVNVNVPWSLAGEWGAV